MLTLPPGHSEAELELAHRVADRLLSEELHVFWTDGPFEEEPELPVFGLTLMAIGMVFTALTSTLTSLGRAAVRSGRH